uniref:NADH-ubiquinone oxidoreductase chain 2 n=1 Tax=Epitonium scalare TaxID=494602 RepID=A0A6B9ML53_9CAEN|nr:NADH dehydrogenase subunit 2 [Epitonium scalare]
MFSSLPYGYLSVYVLVSGTLFSISSLDWFGVWVGLEINLIGFLPMVVYQSGVSVSESAVKYFIVQALGSAFLIVGNLVSVLSLFYFWGYALVIFSLIMKMGGFPFHFWLPSVMSGMNWFPCMVLATWQKIAPLFMILFFFSIAYFENFILGLSVMSVMSAIIGGVGGINQTQVRSLLAYSSISHMGWMVFGMIHSYKIMKFYFIIYLFINLCIFLGLWSINSSSFKDISMAFKDKFYGGLVLFLLVSLAGLPPLLGFVPKWSVILCSMNGALWGFSFFMVLGSLLGIFYYLSLFMYGGLSLGLTFYRGYMSFILISSVMINLLGGFGLVMIYFML